MYSFSCSTCIGSVACFTVSEAFGCMGAFHCQHPACLSPYSTLNVEKLH